MLFIIIVFLVFITQSIFHYWWLAALDSFIASFFFSKSAQSAFLSGFLAVALVWLGQLFFINFQNESLLLNKIADIIRLSPNLIMVIAVLIGGLSGGVGALCAYNLKAIWKKE